MKYAYRMALHAFLFRVSELALTVSQWALVAARRQRPHAAQNMEQ